MWRLSAEEALKSPLTRSSLEISPIVAAENQRRHNRQDVSCGQVLIALLTSPSMQNQSLVISGDANSSRTSAHF